MFKVYPPVPQVLAESDLKAFFKDNNYVMQELIYGERRLICKNKLVVNSYIKSGEIAPLPQSLEMALLKIDDDFYFDSIINEEEDKAYLFDLLEYSGVDYSKQPYYTRRSKLLEFVTHETDRVSIVPTVSGMMDKASYFDRLQDEGKLGVIFKESEPGFNEGKLFIFKFFKIAHVVVDFVGESQRFASAHVFDEAGSTIDIGNVPIPVTRAFPAEGNVIDIRFEGISEANQLISPAYVGVRKDIPFSECLLSQFS